MSPQPPRNLMEASALTEGESRTLLEDLRWPDGPICAHCEGKKSPSAMESRLVLGSTVAGAAASGSSLPPSDFGLPPAAHGCRSTRLSNTTRLPPEA
ncbi:MAG: transposase [Chloroflexi bacterium]|nr:transposase [Chloroflexota bacterium]